MLKYAHYRRQVKTLYMAAGHKLKGVTYMRDGSREGVLSRSEVTRKRFSASSRTKDKFQNRLRLVPAARRNNTEVETPEQEKLTITINLDDLKNRLKCL